MRRARVGWLMTVAAALAAAPAALPQNSRPAPAASAPSDQAGRIVGLGLARVDAPVQRELRLIDPVADGWPSEGFCRAARTVLDELAELIAAGAQAPELQKFVTDDFASPGLRPALQDAFESGGLRVQRGSSYGGGHRGAAGLATALAELRGAFGRGRPQVEFEIDRAALTAEAAGTTRAIYRAWGATQDGLLQQSARWEITWETGTAGRPPRMRSIDVRDFEECRAAGPLYAERTASALTDGATRERLLRSTDDWWGRIDSGMGFSFLGDYGIALADVDNDGLEDLYLCAPGGLPNALLRHNPDDTLTDISAGSGADVLNDSRAALFVDLDNDGNQDLVLATPLHVSVLRGDGAGHFSAATELPAGGVAALSAGDYDGDGSTDLYLCRAAGRRRAEALCDALRDADGGLPNALYRNQGAFAFRDVTADVGLDANNRRFSVAAAWEDFDNDGDGDLYVVNDVGEHNLYVNEKGRFRDAAQAAGAARSTRGAGLACADFDEDADADLYVSGLFSAPGQRIALQERFAALAGGQPAARAIVDALRGGRLLANAGNATFREAAAPAAGGWSFGGEAVDVNNDGRPDLAVPNGLLTGRAGTDLGSYVWRRAAAWSPQEGRSERSAACASTVAYLLASGWSWGGAERNNLLLNAGGGSFVDVSRVSGIDFADDARGAAVVDWDDDGRPDLWLNNRRSPRLRLLRNEIAAAHDSIAVRLVGTSCNRDALGARLELTVGGRTIVRTIRADSNHAAQSTRWAHFGLGAPPQPARLVVRWPDRSVATYDGLASGVRYVITQGDAAPRALARRSQADRAVAQPAPSAAAPPASPPPAAARAAPPVAGVVALGVRLPLPPELPFADFDGKRSLLSTFVGAPLLIQVWSASEPASVSALEELTAQRAKLQATRVAVVACALSDGAPLDAARAAAQRIGPWFATGPLEPATRDALAALVRTVLDRRDEPNLPVGVLVDERGRAARLYLGACSAAQLAADAEALTRARNDVDVLLQAAGPGPGIWQRPEAWVAAQADEQHVRMAAALREADRFDLARFYARALGQRLAAVGRSDATADAAVAEIRAVARGLVGPSPAEAALLLRDVLRVRPNDLDALLGLTDALLAVGSAESRAEAARVFESVRPLLPKAPGPRQSAALGATLYRMGRLDEAIGFLRRAVDADPSDAAARLDLGRALIETGRSADGLAQIELAVRELPQGPETELAYAQALDLAGRRDDAEAHYARVIELSAAAPEEQRAILLGPTLVRLRRWEEAIPHLTKLVEADPSNPAVRCQLGLALAQTDRHAEALEHLERSVPRLPPSVTNEYTFGLVRARNRRFREAAASFRKVLELEPGHRDARRALCSALDWLGDVPEAIKAYQDYLSAVPNDTAMMERLGMLYERGGRPTDAIVTFRSVLNIDPNHDMARFRLAWQLATNPSPRLRNGAEALRLAEEVVRRMGRELAPPLDLLAAAYAENGMFEQAVQTAEEALRIARAQQATELAGQIEARLELYRQKQPFRTGPRP